jgi:hypothetical protein
MSKKRLTQTEAKQYVMNTIKTGNKKRIREVIDRYRKAYGLYTNRPDTSYQAALEVFSDIATKSDKV